MTKHTFRHIGRIQRLISHRSTTTLRIGVVLMVCASGIASVAAASATHWGRTPCMDPTIGISQPAFSPPNVFERPRWIWGTPPAGNGSLIFGRDFGLTHRPKKAVVYAAAKGPIQLWINDKSVALASKRRYRKPASIHTLQVNVTSYLHVGVNHIFFSAPRGNKSQGVVLSLNNRDHKWETIVRTDRY